MEDKKTISILGAGAMGWAIAFLISKNQKGQVRLWDRNPELISEAKSTRRNLKYSDPAIELPEDVLLFTDLKETIEGSDLILLAIPSFAVREVCQRLQPVHRPPARQRRVGPISGFSLPPMLMISKGFEKETALLPFQVVEEVLGKKDILHITGVGFAKEVHKEIPVTELLASRDENLLREVRSLFETDWLTIETSADLLGVQLAGALKNIMVIGIGLAEGEKENPELRKRLIEEGVREMNELGKAVGAEEETFQSPAGRGDLEISADPLSRNYRYGKALFERGVTEVKKELEENGITVEGFHSAFAAHQLAQKNGVKLPIVEKVYQVIYQGKDPKLSARELTKLAG